MRACRPSGVVSPTAFRKCSEEVFVGGLPSGKKFSPPVIVLRHASGASVLGTRQTDGRLRRPIIGKCERVFTRGGNDGYASCVVSYHVARVGYGDLERASKSRSVAGLRTEGDRFLRPSHGGHTPGGDPAERLVLGGPSFPLGGAFAE